MKKNSKNNNKRRNPQQPNKAEDKSDISDLSSLLKQIKHKIKSGYTDKLSNDDILKTIGSDLDVAEVLTRTLNTRRIIK